MSRSAVGGVGETAEVEAGARATRRRPAADDVLRRFFAELRRAATGTRVGRLERAETDVRSCLAELAPRLLTAQDLALLALEEQFEPIGSVARVAGADALLLILPVFLDDPRWHGVDLEDRKLRIRLAEPLMETVVRTPDIGDVGRAAWTVEAAVRHETWLLRQEREAARRG